MQEADPVDVEAGRQRIVEAGQPFLPGRVQAVADLLLAMADLQVVVAIDEAGRPRPVPPEAGTL